MTLYTILKPTILIFLIICLAKCSSKNEIDGFNAEKWQSDKGSCKGERKNQFKTLRVNKDQLKGLGPKEVVELLGKPDKKDLYNRGQMFYLYYMEPGSHCPDSNLENEPLTLRIRFSALNQVTEISFENY